MRASSYIKYSLEDNLFKGNLITISFNNKVSQAKVTILDKENLYIDKIITHKNYRNKGYAKKLLLEIKEWALEEEYEYIYLKLSPFGSGNKLNKDNLREFYKKIGFILFDYSFNNEYMVLDIINN